MERVVAQGFQGKAARQGEFGGDGVKPRTNHGIAVLIEALGAAERRGRDVERPRLQPLRRVFAGPQADDMGFQVDR